MKLQIKCITECSRGRCVIKKDVPHARFLMKQNAPQSRLIKQNAPQARFFG